jgi:hypothetical protein
VSDSQTLHVLFHGRTICDRVSGVPSSWPAGHVWSSLAEWLELGAEAKRCSACEAVIDAERNVNAFMEAERSPNPKSGCYRCGRRMYYSQRVTGLGLCGPCSRGELDGTVYAMLVGLRRVEWSPYSRDLLEENL